MKKTRIIIADDHTLFADGLEQIIKTLDGFEVVGKVTDGKMLMQRLNSVVPDMILMDINMPFLNGLEATQKILVMYPNIKIIFISMYANTQLIEQAKNMSVAGYIMKDVTAPVLKEAIINANNGIAVFPSSKVIVAEPRFKDSRDNFVSQFKLSPREMDIIHLIKQGYASKQIANDLELSIYTVETHRKNIYRKLNVQSSAELLAFIHKWLI